MFRSWQWYFGDWELSVTWAFDHWVIGPSILVRPPLYIFSLNAGPVSITLWK